MKAFKLVARQPYRSEFQPRIDYQTGFILRVGCRYLEVAPLTRMCMLANSSGSGSPLLSVRKIELMAHELHKLRSRDLAVFILVH